MSNGRRLPFLLAALSGAAGIAMASGSGLVELQAPDPQAGGEALSLQVTTGPLPRGARLSILAEDGTILGSVFPFVAPEGTTATVPIPPEALAEGRLRLRLEVLEPGKPARPPRPGEVEHLDLQSAGGGN